MKTLCLMTSVAKIFKSSKTHKEKRPLYQAFFHIFILSFLPFLHSCSSPDEVRVLALEGRTMGTTYHVKAIANHRTIVSESALQIQVDKALEGFNQVVSTYINDSELSLLNKASVAEWHVVSQDLFDIISLGQNISSDTQGAFDVTVGPLVNAWGFGPNKDVELPSDALIDSIRQKTGYRFIELKPQTREVLKNNEIYIDLSAVAKGYGVDVVGQLLRSFGFEDFMVEIGGELYVSGLNPSKKPWIIGVEKPSLGHDGTLQTVHVSNVGVATSGEYRNYYERDGKRISHTVDPVTGYPITHKLASVTVVAENAGLADAYATAINVMGEVEGYDFAVQQKMAAYFIIHSEDGFDVKHTPEFERFKQSL